MANILEVIFKGTDNVTGVADTISAKVGSLFEGMGSQVLAFGEAIDAMSTSDLAMSAGAVAGAVAKVVGAAYELGRGGAAFLDLQDAFSGLTERAGMTNNVLKEMGRITAGTVDDGALMAVMLNTMGAASDDFVQMMMPVQPQLLQIARAAYKLNPTLGDTAEIYGRLNMGIQRHSQAAITSQGIMIDYKQAQDDLASSLGVTRRDLNDTQLSQAMLNAIMASGSGIIANLGDDLTTAGDAYGKIDTTMAKANEKMSLSLAIPIAQGVQNLADTLLTASAGAEALASGNMELIRSYFNLLAAAQAYEGTGGKLGEDWLTKAMAAYTEARAAAGLDFAPAVADVDALNDKLSTVGATLEDLRAHPELYQWFEIPEGAGVLDLTLGELDVTSGLLGQNDALAAAGTSAGAAYAAAFNAAVSQGIDVSGVGAGIAINVIEQLVGTDTSGMALP